MMFSIFAYICFVSAVFADDFLCNDKFPLVTDFGHRDCDSDQYLWYNPTLYHGCIPGCESIRLTSTYVCDPNPCPYGYSCVPVANSRRCVLEEDSCFKYYSRNQTYNSARWKPECLNDKTWAPKQCKDTRCFCYDPFGNRIFGDEFLTQAANMTCACSRKRAELEAAGQQYFISLHCDSMGNYEPLQCDSGQCWCVEPKTGEITAPTVPEKLMSYLPCYDKAEVGDQYLRQCESHLYAQEKIRDEFLVHGTIRTNFGLLRCLYDGSYGPVKLSSGIVNCVWRDNTNIGSYASVYGSDTADMDCNCARDTKIFELAGSQLLRSCSANGNYSPTQQDGADYYCVDSDGHRKSEIRQTAFTDEECAALQ